MLQSSLFFGVSFLLSLISLISLLLPLAACSSPLAARYLPIVSRLSLLASHSSLLLVSLPALHSGAFMTSPSGLWAKFHEDTHVFAGGPSPVLSPHLSLLAIGLASHHSVPLLATRLSHFAAFDLTALSVGFPGPVLL